MDMLIEIFNAGRHFIMPIVLAEVVAVLGWQIKILFTETR